MPHRPAVFSMHQDAIVHNFLDVYLTSSATLALHICWTLVSEVQLLEMEVNNVSGIYTVPGQVPLIACYVVERCAHTRRGVDSLALLGT